MLQETDKEKNEYRTRIWIAAEGRSPVPFTAGPKDHSPRWSPDGRYLAFVSQRSGSAQIWLLPLDGGEARQLTKIKGGCGNPAWSPDGRYLAFTASLTAAGLQPEAKDEEEKDLFRKYTKEVKTITRLYYKGDNIGFFTDKRAQVCVIPVDGGDARQLTTGDFSHGAPTWAPDGKELLFIASRREDADWVSGNNLWSVDVQTAEIKQLTPDETYTIGAAAASPDGRQIAFIANNPAELGYGVEKLYLLDLASGATRPLAREFDRSLSAQVGKDLPMPGSCPLVWAPDSASLLLPVSDAGTCHVVRIETATGKITPVTGGDRAVTSFSLTPSGKRIAYAAADAANPGDIYLGFVDEPAPAPAVASTNAVLKGGGIREIRLTAVNETLLSQLLISLPERFNFTAGEGHATVDGWAIRPLGVEPGSKYPTILEIHGGPAGAYGSNYFLEFQILAALGYGVVYCNPRGSTSYGRDFSHCIMGDWGNLDYADCMAAIETAVKRFDWIDSDRLGVAGGSYGGFMVNWIVGHNNRFKAAVTMRSVVNRFSSMGTSDVAYRRIPQFKGEGYWWQNIEPYLHQSPLMWAHNINTPLLIEHQENDYRCPMEQAEQLYMALKLQKKPVKFVRYPGEGHEMSRSGKPWHRVHRYRLIGDWFDEWLKQEKQ